MTILEQQNLCKMLKEITGYKMVTGKRQDSKALKNCKGFLKKFKRSELLETFKKH